MAGLQNPLSTAMDRSCDLSLPRCIRYRCISNPWIGSEFQTDYGWHWSQFWGIYWVADRHGEQLREFSKAMDIYTVLSVTRDRLQTFDDLVALAYEKRGALNLLVCEDHSPWIFWPKSRMEPRRWGQGARMEPRMGPGWSQDGGRMEQRMDPNFSS